MFRVECKFEEDGVWKAQGLPKTEAMAEWLAEQVWMKWSMATRVVNDDTQDIVCEFEV